MENLFIGLMSGTSVDSIDSALVTIEEDNLKIIESNSYPIGQELKKRIFEAVKNEDTPKKEINEIDIKVGRSFGLAANKLLEKASITSSEVLAIGSHGQTIKHKPDAKIPYSLQIGNPQSIAKITKIRTVADFRTADIEAGGQGAPLTPLFHRFMLKKNNISSAVVINIGGITNLTYFNEFRNKIIAFDCGPGNCLLDSWNRINNKGEYDKNGTWAASGKISHDLLNDMLKDPFFTKPPPKSTGTDYFNVKWLEEKLSNSNKKHSAQDIQATLTELTVQLIFLQIKDFKAEQEDIYLCGGGIHNNFLVKRLQALIGTNVSSTSSIGIDSDFLEASCFAWLAKQRLSNKYFDLSKITGSKEKVLLGRIWEPSLNRE